MNTLHRILGLVVLLALPSAPGLAGAEPPPAALTASAPAEPEPLLWLADLEQALATAEAQARPVFVLFTAPQCAWCERLKQTTLRDAAVQPLLRQCVLALIDVTEAPRTAAAWNVSGVPHLLVLTARGRLLATAVGHRQPAELERLLNQALNPAAHSPASPRTDAVVRLLQAESMPAESWPEVALALAEERARDRVLPAVLARRPLPVRELSALLDDPRLAVRLGAIELLEEVTGANHGFDPWRSPDTHDSNRLAIARFQAHDPPAALTEVFFAFDDKQFSAYVQDVLSGNRQRALRAARMLHRGGANTIKALYDYLAARPELPPPARATLRELQYAIYLDSYTKADGESWAHRLVAGNPDERLQALAALRQLGPRAPPMLKDFLADPSPLVRETAVEVLAQTGAARQVVTLLARHLQTETNREVIFRVLTECRRFRTKSSLNLLLSWIGSEHEDLAIAAIQSIGALRTAHAEEPLLPGLSDPRWRVRLATLETMRTLGYRKHLEQMKAMLKDPDEFVRYKAVEAVAQVAKRDAVGALEAAFAADDALKPAIVAAWRQLEVPLPHALLAGLMEKPPHILVGVLAGIGGPSDDGLTGFSSSARAQSAVLIEFLRRCLEHPEPDVAIAAVQVLAGLGMRNAEARKTLHRTLSSGRTELVRAALHSLDSELDEKERQALRRGDLAQSPKLGALLSLFGVDETAPAAAAPKASTDDIVSAFGFEAQPAAAADSGPPVSRQQLEDLLLDILQTHADAEIRDLALGHLLAGSRPEALPLVSARLGEITADRRRQYAERLANYADEQARPLLRTLLRDPVPKVRQAAGDACLNRAEHDPQVAMLVLAELTRAGTLLQPREAYHHGFEKLAKAGEGPVNWTRAVLEGKEPANTPIQHYALLVAAVLARRDLLAAIEPFVKHADAVVRRAAWHALARTDRSGALDRVDEMLGDSSELVREVVLSLAAGDSGHSTWLTYFDGSTTEWARLPWTQRRNSGGRGLAPGLRQALDTLGEDPFVPLRAKALFALLQNLVSVDLKRLVTALEAIPDAETAAELAERFVEQNLDTLGPPFRVLLPYVRGKRDGNEWFAKRLAERFPDADEGPEEVADLTLALRPPGPAEAQSAGLLCLDDTAAAGAASVPPEDRPVTLLLFTTAGCAECEQARRLLPEMHSLFSALTVQVHDLRTIRAMVLNEALCERFGVSMQHRLTAPAAFTRAGFLIRHEIEPYALAGLLARASAADTDDDSWCRLDDDAAEQADARIGGRHAVIRVSAVLAAGLLDGLNPCAFATILFLLSYLQVVRRTPRQIVRIGSGFVAGVFATYYLLGMGLIEIVTRLEILRRLGHWLNYGLAAFALAIMALSLRDGVLCLRGRMADMSLQLPLVLKRRIHASIRAGSRQTHLVLAACMVGAVVSVLELACTGQVYAPTILYMLKTGRESDRALALLLAYNLAFVAPLCMVFLLACRGLTSDRLRRVFERRAALVKFATAALFLLLAAVLLWGHRVMAWTHTGGGPPAA